MFMTPSFIAMQLRVSNLDCYLRIRFVNPFSSHSRLYSQINPD